MENQCEIVNQENDAKIVKCEDKFFMITGGKRVKIGPAEGEAYKSAACGC